MGLTANIALLSDQFDVAATVVKGRLVYHTEAFDR